MPSIRELDEDPFPLIVQSSQAVSSQSSASSHTGQPPETSFFTDATEHPPVAIAAAAKDKDAVSRARKRLRGEAVSPSPIKEKRPRVTGKIAPQAALTFNEADSSDEDGAVKRGRDTFIDDTPARPPIGKKQFKVLFDEAVPSASQTRSAGARPQEVGMVPSKSVYGKGLFGLGFSSKDSGAKQSSRSNTRSKSPIHSDDGDDIEWNTSASVSSSKLSAPDFSPSVAKPVAPSRPNKKSSKVPGAIIPGKDDLWASSGPKDATKAPSKRRSRSPTTLSNDVHTSDSRSTPKASLSALPLLPPSPPADPQSKPKYNDKGKSKALMRKKAKLLGSDDSEDEGDEADVKVKEVPWRWHRHPSRGQLELVSGMEQQADSELEFDVGAYRPSVPPSLSNQLVDGDHQERFEVDLPEDLRRVLALSPPRHVVPDPGQEEKLVRGLLYGRREGHYDPSRGGEIWGVGEVSGESEEEDALGLGKERVKGREEDEDDWEGEPVPWEVGEL